MTKHAPRDNEAGLVALGQVITRARLDRGQSQTAFAKDAGVDPKTLNSIETGQRAAQDTNLAKIEDALEWNRGSIGDIKEMLSQGGDPRDIRAEGFSINREASEPASAGPVARASALTDQELTAELTYRLLKYGRESN
jgi:transcriptional regulator with XRE-family HTH domain